MVTLQAALLAAALGGGGETVLLDFYADWCGPCQQMSPVVDRLAAAGHPVRKVNVDQEQELAARFGVRGVPCFVMLVDGKEVDRVVGATSSRRLERMLGAAKSTPTAQPERPRLAQGLIGRRRGASGAAGQDLGKPRLARAQSPDAPQVPAVSLGAPGGAQRPQPAGSSSSEAPAFQPPQAPAAAVIESPGLPSPPAAVTMPAVAGSDAPSWQAAPRPSQAPAPIGGSNSPDQQSAPGNDTALEQRLMQASVRMRVEDPSGRSVGSGTIVHAESGQALVVTCAHLFRESKGNGQIVVDVFGPGDSRQVPGKLISYELDNDVALVAIDAQGPVTVAPVAPSKNAYAVGSSVINIGCNHGEDPTLRRSEITSLDKYLGPGRIVVAGRPVEGRSGGGLFNSEGQLIGICHAADPQDNEGLYAALPLVHTELDDAHLAHVYQPVGTAPAAGATAQGGNSTVPAPLEVTGADPAAASQAASATTSNPPSMPASMPGVLADVQNVASGVASPKAVSAASGFASQAMQQMAQAGEQLAEVPTAEIVASSSGGATDGRAEVICVIRELGDPNGGSRVVVIRDPSTALLERLASEGKQQDAGQLTSLQVSGGQVLRR